MNDRSMDELRKLLDDKADYQQFEREIHSICKDLTITLKYVARRGRWQGYVHSKHVDKIRAEYHRRLKPKPPQPRAVQPRQAQPKPTKPAKRRARSVARSTAPTASTVSPEAAAHRLGTTVSRLEQLCRQDGRHLPTRLSDADIINLRNLLHEDRQPSGYSQSPQRPTIIRRECPACGLVPDDLSGACRCS